MMFKSKPSYLFDIYLIYYLITTNGHDWHLTFESRQLLLDCKHISSLNKKSNWGQKNNGVCSFETILLYMSHRQNVLFSILGKK